MCRRAMFALGALEGTGSLNSPEQWSEILIRSGMYESFGRINVLPRVPGLLPGIIYSLAGPA